MKKLISAFIACAILVCSTLSVSAVSSPQTISGNNSIVTPQLFMETFVRYDPSANSINWEKYYVGVYRHDNRNSSVPTTIQFVTTTSGTVTGTLTSSFSAGVEINAAVATVSANIGQSISASRSWSSGTTVGATVSIPSGKVGYIYAYIPGATTSGSKVYKVTNTGYDDVFYINKPVSNAEAPLSNSWNTRTVIQNS